MKKYNPLWSLLFLFLGIVGCAPQERELVILSTNDMHGRIENFARLATAVERCRDTVEVLLIDAGDRWTGNAYVDLAEDRKPILELMNDLGYDLATLGNHEFDAGQALLERAVGHCDFPLICGNIHPEASALLKPFEATRILSRGGIRVGFAGVVTNYGPNGHPDGHDAIFEGLTFSDAVATATDLLSELEGRCDLKVALTHVGLDRDREIAAAAPGYDLIIGGHSHDRANEEVNGVLITQTGSKLRQVGATTIRMRGEEVISCTFRLLSLDDYDPDPRYEERVAAYLANPAMQRPVGEVVAAANHVGLSNLFAESVRRAGEAEVGLYHSGGVRLDTLPMGRVPIATIYDLDPFSSRVSTLEMTPEQLRRMIIAKFNDPIKKSESHCIDLYATVPYTVVTNEKFDAVDAEFPTLKEGRRYRVAMGDYIFKTYSAVEGEQGRHLDILVTDALIESLSQAPYAADNRRYQSIR